MKCHHCGGSDLKRAASRNGYKCADCGEITFVCLNCGDDITGQLSSNKSQQRFCGLNCSTSKGRDVNKGIYSYARHSRNELRSWDANENRGC